MKWREFLCIVIIHCSLFSGGQSLNLSADADESRIDIGDLDIGGKAITVEAIISMLPGDNQRMNIVCKHYDPNDMNYTLRSSEFMIRTERGFVTLKNPMRLCANNTYHVAATYDGSDIIYYVNGVEVASLRWTGNLQLNNNIAAIGNMWNQEGMFNEQYLGYIDEVRIWNVARSQQEIAANMYTLPNPAKQPGLLAYYKFEGNFKNMQGNAKWDGKASNSRVSLNKNPYFNGALSTCGGTNRFIATAKTVAPPPIPKTIADIPKTVPNVAVAAVIKPVPIVSAPKPVQKVVAAVPKPVPEITVPAPRYVSKKAPETNPASNAYTKIEIWDSDCMDFDSVSLKLNGKQLGPVSIPIQLYKKYGSPEFTYELDLQPGDNTLEIYALNEGMNPFNTVGILLMNDRNRRKLFFKLKGKQRTVVHLFK